MFDVRTKTQLSLVLYVREQWSSQRINFKAFLCVLGVLGGEIFHSLFGTL